MNKENEEVEIPFSSTSGAHGGGDARLLEMIFGEGMPDLLGQCSDSFAGVASAMIGIAANESIKSGCVTDISERLNLMR